MGMEAPAGPTPWLQRLGWPLPPGDSQPCPSSSPHLMHSHHPGPTYQHNLAAAAFTPKLLV